MMEPVMLAPVVAANFPVAHTDALAPLRRGLHYVPFQLNLSSSVHRVTQLNS